MCPVRESRPTGAKSGKRSAEAETPSGDRPLEGVRVLDLTQVVAGPYCTLMLADLGAEVVKVERPDLGDDMRTIGRAPDDPHERFFYPLNRAKKSITLDLKDASEREIGHQLARRADVVVENFAPGTADRLAMGWSELEALNQRLIYCSLSGFGQTGPYRDRLAVDPIIQAVSGVMSVTGEPDGEPMQIGAPLGDVIAGMFAAFAIVGYLHEARREGRGRYIDVSMQASMVAALGPRLAESLLSGVSRPRLGNQNPIRVPTNIYIAGDGIYLNISVSHDGHWAAICRALEREDWLSDARLATMRGRIEHRDEVDAMISARIAERPANHWSAKLAAERVPFAPVNDYVAALADEQIGYRGLVQSVDHASAGAISVIGPPWHVPGTKARAEPPPVLGEHTEEVLRDWLGWSEADAKAFRDRRSGAPTTVA